MQKPVLKQVFQAAAFMLAQVAVTDPYAAANSTGVLYDNVAAKVKSLLKPNG